MRNYAGRAPRKCLLSSLGLTQQICKFAFVVLAGSFLIGWLVFQVVLEEARASYSHDIMYVSRLSLYVSLHCDVYAGLHFLSSKLLCCVACAWLAQESKSA